MYSLRQRGEIAFTLSLVGLLVSLIGIGIGAFSVNKTLTTGSQAQSGDFPYESIMEVRQGSQSGPVVNWETGLRWKNNFPTTINQGDVRDAFGKARVVWTVQSMDSDLRNQTAFVTLTTPPTLQIIGTFCEDRAGNTCAAHQVSADKREIWNLRLTKDAKITYGWIVSGGSTGQPEPTAIVVPPLTSSPGQPTTAPQPTTGQQPTTPPSQVGVGNLEVQIVALNYPKRTSFWSGNHIASKAPTSCERLPASSQQRPLYLNKVSVVATCIAGDCTVGKVYEGKNEKNQGYVNFNGVPTGTYRLDRMKDLDGKGFSLWNGCRNKTFTVEKDKINQQAVMILENKADGTYETYTTESACKSDGGEPNLIQGIGGNLCYLPQGKPAPVQPTTPPGGGGGGGGGTAPTQHPGSDLLSCARPCIYSDQGRCWEGRCQEGNPDCKSGIENANKGCRYALTQCGTNIEVSCKDGTPIGGGGTPSPSTGDLTVKVNNRSPKIKTLVVQLGGCEANNDSCKKTLEFGGQVDKQLVAHFSQLPKRKEHHVTIREIRPVASLLDSLKGIVFAQENGIVRVDRCPNGYKQADGDDEKCVATNVPTEVEMSVHPVGGVAPTPAPPAPPTPGDGTIAGSQCKYTHDDKCGIEVLEPYFAEFKNLDPDVVKKMSAICNLEGSRRNTACLHTGRNCYIDADGDGKKELIMVPNCVTQEYSVGYFQINTIFPAQTDDGRSYGPCVTKNFTDEQFKVRQAGDGPACSLKPDTEACASQVETRDVALAVAKAKFRSSNYQPWTTAQICGFRLP